MRTHSFTIIASGVDMLDDVVMDRFFEAGCDDATVSFQKGLVVLEFQREAKTRLSALVSAIIAVGKAGAEVERIEPDYLVSSSEIARRAGLVRATVSLYSEGKRGAGFPPPVARVTSDSPLWDWVEVSSWMYRQGKISSLQTVVEARMVRDLNREILMMRDRPHRALENAVKASSKKRLTAA